MIRLIGAEIVRLFSRRFTVISLIVVLLVLAAFQLAVSEQISPPTGDELAVAQRNFEESHQHWEENHVEIEQECRDNGQPVDQCSYVEPKLEDFTGVQAFGEIARQALQVAIYLGALATFMIAGSFIGAEYSSGSIANWLSFIPRRGRVFTAKVVTIAGFAALVSATGSALTLGTALILARVHGTDVGSVAPLVAMAARGILPAVGLAVLGFCIGLVARHTAAAIGTLLGFMFVWFVRNAVLSGITWAQELTPWSPEGNISAIVDDGSSYSVPIKQLTAEGVQYTFVERTISFGQGVAYWAVLTAVVILVAWLVFRRRDVN